MKLKKIAKKSLSMLLATALTVSGLALDNSSVLTVKAEEIPSKPLSVTAFATPEQLMSSFDLDGTDDTVGKVYFGTNGSNKQNWYIAGSDEANSIVLLCDPELPMATSTQFANDCVNKKTYSADWSCIYETAPNEVYPNHYGASDLRGVLQGYTSNDNTEKFSAAEKELMQSTKVYTDDDKLKDEGETDYTYYTEDVLYPAYEDFNDKKYITVGANSADSLNDGLKVSLTDGVYASGDIFWLRAPRYNYSGGALVASPGHFVDNYPVNMGFSVVPAFRLNLSSVIFASAAPAATSDASLTDTMTFRVDGDDEITSQAYYSTDNVIVDAAGDETVYLYVQGNDGTSDWVYSQEVSTDGTIEANTIMSGAKDSNGKAVSLTSVDLSQCKIWIEKKVTDDNLVYAVMAKEIETVTTVAVTDITEPVAGAELGVAATCNTTGVSTTTPTVSYTKNGEQVSGNAAGYLASYTATVELEAAGGYVFTDETTATINGNEASVSYDATTGKLTVSYTFDKTAKLPLGNTYYVTKEELMSSFDLDGTDDTVGKVYFGTNTPGGSTVPQTWYIAGSDADNSIVLLCDPALPMATDTIFEVDWENNKAYSADWSCTYETAPSEVYPNHYGASDLRLGTEKGLKDMATDESRFTTAEQDMMQSTKVYTDVKCKDGKTESTYYTEDVLYPAYGDVYDKYITVGANSAVSLKDGLKVSLKSEPYNSTGYFWLRAPDYFSSDLVLVARPGVYVSNDRVCNGDSVVPAFRLNLSSVLFASAATAATSSASLTDTMTFRVDGADKITSKAVYTAGGVTVNYNKADSTDDGKVFLYVLDADSVYSKQITEDTTVKLTDMTGISSLTDGNIKIWLEKSEDNVAYAGMAEAANVTHVVDKDATCEADGNSEYWCFKIGEDTYYFSDEDCSVSIENEPVITKTGHKWSYSLSGETTIVATCENGCQKSPVTFTLTAPENAVYGGSEHKATVTASPEGVLEVPDISYNTSTINAGEVTASIVMGEGENKVTASVTYIIEKAIPDIGTGSYVKTYGDAAFTLDVTDTNEEASVQYEVTEGEDVVSVSNNTVTILKAGNAIITVSLPESTNYNAESKTINVTVNKADKAPNMPGNTISAPYSDKTVGAVTLPKDWAWQEADKDTVLEVGVSKKVTAVYTGTDKGNYENETVEITITRSACVHSNTEVRDDVEATCGAEGYTGDTYCKACGAKTADGEAIAKTEHTYGEPEFTWSEDGKICTVTFTCENDVTHTDTQDATVTSEVKTAAICKDKGTTTYKATYTDEDKVYTDEGKTYSATKDVVDIPVDVANHTGETEVKATKEATCGAEGYTGDTYCKACGTKTADGTKTDKLTTHTWDAGVVTKEATTTEKGVKTYTCSVCETTKTEEIPVKSDSETPGTNPDTPGTGECEHEESDILYTGNGEKAPTCTEAGIGHTECTKCKEVMQSNVTVEATGHNGETEVKNAKKATCGAEGNTGDTYCKACGTKIADGTKTEKLTAHAWDAGVVTKEATATEKGEKTYTCSVCKTTKKEEIPVLGVPKVGEQVTSADGATYTVTATGETGGSVTYVAPADEKAATVVIPATITIDNITYKVTKISDTAFAGNKNLTSVTIGDNVTSIPVNAFKNFKKLVTVKMGTGVKSIGKNAFYGCSKLKTLTIKSTKLETKKIGSKAFGKTPKSMTVKIPKKKFKDYKSMLIKRGVNKKAKFKKN